MRSAGAGELLVRAVGRSRAVNAERMEFLDDEDYSKVAKGQVVNMLMIRTRVDRFSLFKSVTPP